MTTPIGTIGTIGAATLRDGRPITAPACHDLPELIEGDPATAWTWDREGESTALGGHDKRPVSPWPDHKRRKILFPTLKTPEAPE